MPRDAPVVDVLLMPAALCAGGLAHIVREQVMATDAKSKAAANFLKFRFIDVFLLVLVFQLLHSGQRLFGSRTSVFLSGKAEIAVKTCHVFHRVGVRQRGIFMRFQKADAPSEGSPAKVATLRCRLTSTSKAAASRPLTAAEVRANLAYSGSTAIPNGPGQLGTNL
jgi:hypothetical protein